jgi:ABC-type nitrate/sulfonate/bicarbonate transport system permease component
MSTTAQIDSGVIPAAPPSGSSRGRTGKVVLGRIGSLVLSILVVLAAWKIFLWALNVNPFIARGPEDVWKFLTSDPEAAANRDVLWQASKTTIWDAMLGLFSGAIAGLLCAVVFNLARSVEQAVMPVALAFSAVPLVAMTPLIALIFGRGLMAVTVIAGIVTFFPVLVNVTLALRSAPAASVDLCTAYGGSQYVTMRKVQFPHAMPALFAALRMAAPLALIGALLAEWLATGKGLGYLMLQSQTLSEYSMLWAAVALVTTYSIVVYSIISGVERMVLGRYGDPTRR